MSLDRGDLDALLDSTVLAHIAFVDDGTPAILPTAVARWGDRLLTHGSTGSRWMRRVAAGVPVAVSVAVVEGVVVARSAFESSLLYTSAVLFGQFRPLDEAEHEAALDVLTDRVLPGRTSEVRRPTRRELAATLVLAMPIDTWSLRRSDGWPEDPEEDVAGPAWAGHLRYGPPPVSRSPAPDLRPGTPEPGSLDRVSGVR
jgi:nitroimidazol reductase NimA-like FMN-containing flavoprotein (pyridoxamine 5'-phosphate oxidase superfamily)